MTSFLVAGQPWIYSSKNHPKHWLEQICAVHYQPVMLLLSAHWKKLLLNYCLRVVFKKTTLKIAG